MATTAPAQADQSQQPPLNAPPPAVAPDTTTAPPPMPPAQVAALAVQLEDEDRAAGAAVTDQHVAVPHEAFRRIKDSAKDKGRKEHEAALNARAAALGFPNVEAMFAAIEKGSATVATNAPPPAPASPPAAGAPAAAAPAPAPSSAPAPGQQPAAGAAPGQVEDPAEPENDRRVPEHVRKRLREARNDMRSKTAQAEAARVAAEQQYQAAQQQMAVMRTEQVMREELIRTGVQDIDYVWYQAKQYLETIKGDEEKLKAFDIKTWAGEQRKLRPYLFGEQPIPANTGPTTAPPATPPTPGDVTQNNGDANKVDARNLSPADFKKRMQQIGINVQGSNPPLKVSG